MIDLQSLARMSTADLIELNRQAVALVKSRKAAANKAAAKSFRPGQHVKFFSTRLNREINGSVIRAKVKMVTVDCGVAGRWDVAGNLLRSM